MNSVPEENKQDIQLQPALNSVAYLETQRKKGGFSSGPLYSQDISKQVSSIPKERRSKFSDHADTSQKRSSKFSDNPLEYQEEGSESYKK